MVAKTHSMPYLYRSFSEKEQYVNSSSFAENDLQFEASYVIGSSTILG